LDCHGAGAEGEGMTGDAGKEGSGRWVHAGYWWVLCIYQSHEKGEMVVQGA
jgi:hypothetical protein